MRKLIATIIAVGMLVSSASLAAKPTSEIRPTVLVFGGPVGDRPGIVPGDLFLAVMELLGDTGKMQPLAFNPDLPSIRRAVIEKRVTQEAVNGSSDAEQGVKVARGIGAAFALYVGGSVTADRAIVVLDLVSTGEKKEGWRTSFESELQKVGGATNDAERRNAVYTAAGSAVSQVVILGLGQLAGLEASRQTVNGASEQDATADETPPSRDIQAEYGKAIKQAEEYVRARDVTNAIQEFRRAINLSPTNSEPRMRLAQLFLELGMTAEALDECKRALLFNNDLTIRGVLAKLYLVNGAVAEAAEQYREMLRLDPSHVEARLNLGDLYWNEARMEDAAQAYTEAGELAPDNPAPHERLRRLYTAGRMYDRALEQALKMELLAVGDKLDDTAKYAAAGRVLADEFGRLLGKLSAANESLDNRKMSREECYREYRDAEAWTGAMDDFLAARKVPQDRRTVNAHGILAISLLSQANGYMFTYLEDGGRYDRDQAELLAAEANKEMALFTEKLRQ